MKAIRINRVVVEIVALVVGSVLILSAALGMMVKMGEDMIAIELTGHPLGSGKPLR
jgi:hypothetical protein